MDELIKNKIKNIERYFNILISPRLKDEEDIRRERILNVLLLCVVVVSVVTCLLAGVSYSIAISNHSLYRGISGVSAGLCVVFFLFLYLISRIGKSRLVAYFLVLFLFFSAVYTSYKWGANVPQAVLIDALIITMAGILVGTRFAFNIVLLIIFSLLILLDLLEKGLIKYDLSWAVKPPEIGDILINSIIFLVIAIISWLSNREIEKALRRAKKSEMELKKERDQLEIQVEKRTKELKKVQLEKITNLYRFADFGRLTAGLFHDIANPLTQVSLNLSNIENKTKNKLFSDLKEIDPVLKRAINGTKQMERLVVSVRKQIQEHETKKVYSPQLEIESAIESFQYKIKEMRVQLEIIGKQKIYTFGNPIRFYQLISNLVSNALDSYYEIERRENRKIIINLTADKKNIILTIQDFGCGIDKENINKIFNPLFTTKDSERGTGVGLYVSKDIVEKELMGIINVESILGEGTFLKVIFPIKKNVNG